MSTPVTDPAPATQAKLEDRLRSVLSACEDLVAAYLFGSRAQEHGGPASDVDVAVLCRRALPLDRLLEIEGKLVEVAGLPVDLVDLRRASPMLALDVIRGVRIVEVDATAADEYELFVLRRAGDLEPLERERRLMLLGGRR